jgi:hypothetical protein
MTAPLPPTAGETPVGDRLSMQDTGPSPEIQADLPDLSAMAAGAQSAGDAWQHGGSQWADSPQGAGLDGWNLGGDHPAGADADGWPSDVGFPHQGP